MAGWFLPADATNFYRPMSLSASGSANYYSILLRGDVVGDPVEFHRVGSTTQVIATSSGYSGATWTHAACSSSGSADASVYINGGSKGTGSTSITTSGINDFSVNAQYFSGSYIFSGATMRAAFVALWNVVLADDEIAALGQILNGVPCGVHPSRIRPESLVACWPLGGFDGDHDGDIWANAYNLTAYNSPTWDESPAVLYSVPPQIVYPTSAGGGGGSPLTSWWAWNQFGTPLDHGARN